MAKKKTPQPKPEKGAAPCSPAAGDRQKAARDARRAEQAAAQKAFDAEAEIDPPPCAAGDWEENTPEALVDPIVPSYVGRQMAVGFAYGRGLIGCPLDVETQPDWARKIARADLDRMRGDADCDTRAEAVIPGAAQGKGRGQRAVHFQHAMRLDPHIFEGAQNYNNCSAWATREGVGAAIAVDVIARKELHRYVARPGTAGIYAYRGQNVPRYNEIDPALARRRRRRGQPGRSDSGMSIYLGAAVVHKYGIGLEIDYPGIADLSTEAADELAGVRWGGSGPPGNFRQEVAGDRIGQIATVDDEEALLDLLYAAHFTVTGSTITAGGPGDPISPAGGVGGHAQLLAGYDDTDEFRDWYREVTGKRLTEWVGIFDQSWPANWLKVEHWPEHLWGPRPEGAFVLRGRDVLRMIDTRYGRAVAMSKVVGFPVLELPPWDEALSSWIG